VLVAGGIPEGSRDLIGARERVRDAIGELAPHAASAGVTLAIEPLHPMYASDRAVVSTLGQAIDIAADFAPDVVGVTVDTFHIWWDPDVLGQIARAGREGRIATYQVCDWKTPLPADVLLSRHYPGDGVIDFASLTGAVLETGYRGDIEVEIFNAQIWADTPANVVRRTAETFGSAISPHLRAPVDSAS
jgi:sugar phosphate isomerase/epimerase